MRLHLVLLPLLFSAFVFIGCGPMEDTLRSAGASCEATDQCETGLACLDFAQHSAESCTVVGQSCSVACSTDVDCQGIVEGATFKCFKNCDETSSCGRAG